MPMCAVVDLCELVVDSVVSWASSAWEVAVSQLEQQPHGASIQWGPACRTGGFGPRVPGSMCEVSGWFFFPVDGVAGACSRCCLGLCLLWSVRVQVSCVEVGALLDPEPPVQ